MARFAIFIGFLCGMAALAQSPLERAVTLTREKHYAEARETLLGVPEPATLPQRIAFHRLKAAVASGLGDPAAATAEIRAALALAPADAGLLLATAVAERQSNDLDAALEHAKAAGSNPIALALAGDIEEIRNKLPEATAAWREAVRLEPSREEYRAALGAVLIRGQNFDDAIDILRAGPKSARLMTLLGIAQFARGDSDEAAITISSAIAIDPTSASSYSSLARIVLQSSIAPSANIIAQLCGWNATVCAALRIRTARESGDAAQLAVATEVLAKADPDDVVARCELARAREWSDRLPEARTEMEKCVAADPTPQNHYRLGLIYRRLGLADLATREMETRQRLLNGQADGAAMGPGLTRAVR